MTQRHPTCESLGIDSDQMWSDFLYLEEHGKWSRWPMDWPHKVLEAYGVQEGMLLVLLESWCRRERIRTLETKMAQCNLSLGFIMGAITGLHDTMDPQNPLRSFLESLLNSIPGLTPEEVQQIQGEIQTEKKESAELRLKVKELESRLQDSDTQAGGCP